MVAVPRKMKVNRGALSLHGLFILWSPEFVRPGNGIDPSKPGELVVQHLRSIVLYRSTLEALNNMQESQSHVVTMARIRTDQSEGVGWSDAQLLGCFKRVSHRTSHKNVRCISRGSPGRTRCRPSTNHGSTL